MAADGTDQELLAPFDFGATGSFQRTRVVARRGQRRLPPRRVAAARRSSCSTSRAAGVRQLTSSGRNEDPTWAPDGRHVAFISDRTGRRQIWIIDTETGRVRQLQHARRRPASLVVPAPRPGHGRPNP